MTVSSSGFRFACYLPVAGLALLSAVCADSRAAEPTVDFNREVRPILSDKCFRCHGPDASERATDLRLDVEASAMGDLGGQRAIVPGQPEASEMIARITSEDEFERMPPEDSGKTLSPEQISVLRRWIEQGANWSLHWAYAPPQRHPEPPVADADWPRNWIDRFVLARLEEEGLRPSADADRVTLIRRLSFDLTGLPPTPEDVDRFVADLRPGAYESLVDRLLGSERFGERMAMYWLDLVRYADTVGYHGDQDHNISPYRDYVIDAFNDNKAFDQFTLEQLAGDLLPNSTIDQKIATGYNRLLQTSHEGGVQAKEYLAIYAADRVRNVSAVWLGATMGCAQCHDHKYDPYTAKDFYSMVAFFADIDEATHLSKATNALPTARPPEMKVLSHRQRSKIAELQQRISALQGELEDARATDKAERRSREEEIAELTKQKEAIESETRTTMITVAIEPRTIRVLPRGDWLDDSGEVVSPAAPSFLGEVNVRDRRANRRDLAEWLTNSEDGIGGLTARVQANRFWYLMFGAGIVRVLDDFGGQGEPPTHPKLLDTLAKEFVESGWNVKQLVKRIVMSRAYQQSSLVSSSLGERDPYNRLLARQARFRLPAEMIRDNALAVSGLLVLDYGGGSVKPYQPAGYYRHLNFPQRTYAHDTDRRQWRRGVYVHWQRQFLHPMLLAFDAPLREECTARRPRSNTPMAALVLLNDPTFVESARSFAAHILSQEGEDNAARLSDAFRKAVSRRPDAYEQQVLGELLASSKRYYAEHQEEAKRLIHTGLSPLPEGLDSVELAAWTAVARAVLNMNEAITRN